MEQATTEERLEKLLLIAGSVYETLRIETTSGYNNLPDHHDCELMMEILANGIHFAKTGLQRKGD